MNRRKSLIVALLCVANGAMAQSVEDGLKDLYYGKYETAKGNLEKAIAAKPTDDRGYYYLGIAQLGLHDDAGAAATFQKGLQAVPTSPLLQAGLGRIDLLKGDAAAAKQKFEAASTAAEGRNGDVARAIADANTEIKGGDRGYALSVMEKLLNNEGRKKKEVYTAKAADYIELGDAYRLLGGENGGKAITSYDKALEMEPNNAEAVMKQGLVNYNAKLLQDAVNDWTKATNLDPNYAPAYYELYQFYITPTKAQLSLENAAKYLEKYMEVIGSGAGKLENEYNLAAISFYRKDYDAAINKAKAVLPQTTEGNKGKFVRLLTDAYLQKGDTTTGKQVIEEYAKSVGDAKLQANDYKLLSAIYQQHVKDSAQEAVNDSLAGLYLEKYALADTAKDVEKYRAVADNFKAMHDFKRSAQWYGKLVSEFTDEQNTGKVQDMFFKGTMEIYAREYDAADSTWGAFAAKYPNNEALGIYWRGRANMAKDPEAKLGAAIPYFQKFFEIKGDEKMNKPSQLMFPYQYMMIYYYNKDDQANMKIWMDKVLAIDPNNATVKAIQENQENKTKAAAVKPAQGNKR
ncbi:lipopolysaccharide assembly protein LapB [Chitinophaga sp. CF418]|uniref:tetratricopeptide repeat protein n=1 Tax=Chitinophaga sp. CF418 TaxID=1855287 RepID=UPI00091595A6|nr:tetratricopeptide repeat protein [Chitinophaga sp. CF418]SHM10623.1 Flp pilus assembly protein TadD, contains TPR repeats [Chitinophaga sp. CF418]